jgi:hypothetical protein
MKTALKAWLPLAVLTTFLIGTCYVVSQQVLRQSANDPQIQLAQDWAGQIVSGTDPNRLSLGAFIDPALSLATFGIVYDQDGNIIASSVSAPSTMKQPNGVFDTVDTAAKNEAHYTWQPASGERYAAVMKRAVFQDKSYYVLAGRNLKVVEERTSKMLQFSFAGWAGTLVAIVAAQNLHLVGHAVRRIRKKT